MVNPEEHPTNVTLHDPVQPGVSLELVLQQGDDPADEHSSYVKLISNEPLGMGTFGAVYAGVYLGRLVAVKFASNSAAGGISKEALEMLHHEVNVLSRVRHPNIVKFWGASLKTPVFTVEELIQADLGQLLHDERNHFATHGLLPLDDVLRIGCDIIAGLAYLHPTIVHQGLKPANVLLDSKGTAKISDFGMARFKLGDHLYTKNSGQGTVAYMAPECFERQEITSKADVYSWAIIMCEMLSGQPPWFGCNNMTIMMSVVGRHERPDLPENPERCPRALAALIKDCWQHEAAKRPSAGDILKLMMLQIERRDIEGQAAIDAE